MQRISRRNLLKCLASAAAGLAAAGCQTQTRLVRSPATPYFGPRVAQAPIAPTSGAPVGSAPRATVTQASWTESAWDVGGQQRRWQYIVVHHSATLKGSAVSFDRMHRENGWDELGYHFVIGNGTGSGNGEIEVGGRWIKQKHGAHCKVVGHPEYNDVGIGVCLVGDFNKTVPAEAQMAGLARLVRYLMGQYAIPRRHVYGHGDLKATDCPGRMFPMDDLMRRL